MATYPFDVRKLVEICKANGATLVVEDYLAGIEW